jgi:starch synthase
MRIVMVSAEVETFARTGGLGDAVYGLSRALCRAGHDVVVVTPLYGITTVRDGHWWYGTVLAPVGGIDHQVGVLEIREEHGAGSLRFCLVASDHLYGGRLGIYGDEHGTFGDNDVRFAVMSRAALEIGARVFARAPDVIHAHDWHASTALVYARGSMGEWWARIPQVFTIHNLAYQGVFGLDAVGRLGLPHHLVHAGCLEHFGAINLIKGAIALADRITAVSPTFALEIQRPEGGFGLDGFVRAHAGKLVGIVNGIDIERFDPNTDPSLAARFGASDHAPARRINRTAVAREMGLDDDDAPLFGVVSRLTSQKGIDLLFPAIPALVEQGARFAFVGTGEKWLEQRLREIAWRFSGRVAAKIAFDRALAQRIYGGADFVVVPSRFEPCGLTQLYAMRYGAIPVVVGVGGLRDTVQPANLARQTGTGFVAQRPDVWELLIALEDALTAYRAPRAMHALRIRAMERVFSWDDSAASYARVYGGLG